MKAIINGKRFDTDKANLLAEVSHGYSGDFHRYEEALYQTPRSGAYFLAGEGGPRSRYAISDRPGEWRSGQKITPLTADEAMRWAEEHGLTDLLEAHFSDRIEDA
ncbi:hypothetical protein [Paracoccus sp. (in: a-proteobacteria)]|uniref:hypothetical protein n=1 Tax=Paracoccus sp. TaxID=267 RepID=UPI00272C8E8D|nr:hypothetical protein [Paracoccus sp. (in: a-proteobacteria)]